MFAEIGTNNMLVASNTFSDNQATDNGTGRSGGLAVVYSDDNWITMRGNQFLMNRASLDGPGLGGSLTGCKRNCPLAMPVTLAIQRP